MKIELRSLRRALLVGTASIAALALLTSCGLSSSNGTDSGPKKTDLVIGIGQLAPSADIHVDSASTSRNALDNVYDRLVDPDFKGGWLPNVATEWSFNDDITALTFTLRDDVSFTNGEKLDAAAVKYSLDRIMDPANKAYALGTLSGKFSGAEVIDATHVKLLVKNNDVTAMSALAQLYLVPPVYSAKAGMGMGGEGIGSGPMMIKSFAPNDHLTLVPNPDYWGDNKVKLSAVTWLSIQDEAARSSALASGRADVVFPLSPDIWEGLKKSKTVTTYSTTLGQYQNLFLGKTNQDTPLKDKRVRQAISHAIDTQSIADNVLRGTTEPISQLVEDGTDYFNSDLKPYAYDPAKAKELLSAAGYPNGFTIKMESTAGRTPGDREVAAAIVSMLAKVGIVAQWTPLPASEWLTKFVTGTGAPLFMLNTSVEPAMMPESGLQQWTSGSFTKVFGDPVYDGMIADMLKIKDQKERAAALQKSSAYLLDAAPIAMLYKVPMLYGVSANVKGFNANPDLSTDLSAITITD